MAGGDWVQVDGPRAQAAASALEGLRNALSQQVPAIQAAIAELRSLGAAMAPPAALATLAGRAPADAAEMRAAADLAALMQRLTPGAVSPVTGMVQLGEAWDSAGLTRAAARADAAALATVVTGKMDPANRALLAEITRDVADHQGNAGYLSAFWSAPGAAAAAAGLAGALNRADGHGLTALTAPDHSILATYGASLAAATRSGQLTSAASHELITAFSRPATLWSAAMMLKYGPSGSAYGTATGAGLLAAMSRAALDAVPGGGVIVPVTSPVAGAFTQPTVATLEQYQQALATYDPVTAILTAAAQNGAAAADVLGGPGGEGYAHTLLATQWTTGGAMAITPMDMHVGAPIPVPGVDTSAAPAAFLTAATADQASRASAESLLSILAANAQIPTGTALQSRITGALYTIAQGRVPDLALTAGQAGPNWAPGVQLQDGIPMGIANQQQLDLFLRRIAQDPVTAGRYLGSVQAKLALAVQMQVATKNYWVKDVGALAGMTQRAIGENNFQRAEKLAAEKAQVQAIASLALSPIMMIPTPAPTALAVSAILKPVVLGPMLGKLGLIEGSTAFGDYGMAGGDPAKVLFQTDQAFVTGKTAASLMVVQGLVRAGVLKPDPSFYQNGHVVGGSGLAALLNGPVSTSTGMTLQQWVQQAVTGMELQQ